jgi:hypothetical protein
MSRILPRRLPRRLLCILLVILVFLTIVKLMGNSIDDDEEWYKHPHAYYTGIKQSYFKNIKLVKL